MYDCFSQPHKCDICDKILTSFVDICSDCQNAVRNAKQQQIYLEKLKEAKELWKKCSSCEFVGKLKNDKCRKCFLTKHLWQKKSAMSVRYCSLCNNPWSKDQDIAICTNKKALSYEEYIRFYEEESKSQYMLGLATPDVEHFDNLVVVGAGFLKFDESACSWGGPFEGDYAIYRILDLSKASIPVNKFNKNSGRLVVDCGWEVTKEKPVEFKFYGNDDTSYTNTYPTVESALEDFHTFEQNQPLAFKDVKDFGFRFTN